MPEEKYLGIDYGKRSIGLALGSGAVAVPHTVLQNTETVYEALAAMVASEHITTIVVGVPMSFAKNETDSTKASKEFITMLEQHVSVPVLPVDETLTSKQAQRMGSGSGDDAHAAALLLQTFLDSNVTH